MGAGIQRLFRTKETIIKPRAVLALQNTPPAEYGGVSGLGYAKSSDWERKRGWQQEYLKDLLEIANKMSSTSSVLMSGGTGGGDIVAVARGEIGQGESGYNVCKYTKWLNREGQPWCAMFVYWCGYQLGYVESGLFPGEDVCAHSANFWNHVLENPDKGSLYTPADVRSGSVTPCAGDLLIISAKNNREASSNTEYADATGDGTRHIAIVTGYDSSTGVIATIDGNSSDMVKENTYTIAPNTMKRNIWGFVRPAYPSAGVEISGGIAHTVQGLDMDTDGSTDPADRSDPYYQAQTSLQTADGYYVDASKVNYVVVARGKSSSLLGCLVTIKDVSSGKVINCISADTGPRSDDWNEVSVCAGRSLGYSVNGNIGVSTDHQFVITYFPECRLTIYANGHGAINDQINEQAAVFAKSKGNLNTGYTPNFGAGDAGGGKID